MNVSDIESRDVYMQSHQLERGFDAELDDLSSAVGDYSNLARHRRVRDRQPA